MSKKYICFQNGQTIHIVGKEELTLCGHDISYRGAVFGELICDDGMPVCKNCRRVEKANKEGQK